MTELSVDLGALRQVFREQLTVVPLGELERFAEHYDLLSGGYRKGANGELLRTLVVNAYGSKLTTYSLPLATFCRTHFAAPRLTSMLAREILEERRYQFYAFFGKATFLFALLMDTREDVREKALSWMDASGAELPDASTARDLLARAFSPIVALGDGAPSGNARQREEVSHLKSKLAETEKSLKQARRERDEAVATVQRDAKSQLATAQFGITERQRRIEQLESALQKAEATVNEKVKTLLAVRQAELFRGWLKPCLALEACCASDTTTPLLERAEAALAQQAKFDRASANHRTLTAHLDAVTAMLQTVDRTLDAAMNRHPQLLAIRQELVTEQQRLVEVLQVADENPLVQQLMARLTATTDEDYEVALATLQQCRTFGLIGKETADRLLHAFHRRAAIWSSGTPEEKDVEENPIERRNPTLTAALRGQAPLILFLDGHNILNGLGRYKQRRGTAVTHEDARRRVEADVAKMFSNTPQVAVHLVWDGRERSSHNLSDNVLVHYSGGEGEHRADRYIVDQIAYTRKQTDLPMVLVTDDHGFGGDAIKLGASVCKLHDFEAFLNTPLYA